jgi:cell wall assembly regulator SMI1
MKTDYADAFDEVTAFLRSQGVEPEIKRSAVATPEDLARFRDATGIELPPSFRDFFTTFANGFEHTWDSDDEGGGFSMPDLATLADRRRDWVERVSEFADDSSSMDQCVEPEYRDEAFRIWSKMMSWVPFIEESDGDAFCLDLVSGAIVFDKHDWFDGFGEIAETNGMIAGSSLLDFIRTWGRFSFAPQWFTDTPHPATQTHLEWIPGDSRFEQ